MTHKGISDQQCGSGGQHLGLVLGLLEVEDDDCEDGDSQDDHEQHDDGHYDPYHGLMSGLDDGLELSYLDNRYDDKADYTSMTH